ncbi:hypothetical protein D3H65_19975 [Paraflavitalea soli]|uniref:Uncharacterized protein n=1 Tax=Paraflavitalea soli TaxID=2315862 RepID=A0A3B7MWS2_9BACT|nr:hypothetical protein [Paraflavitalea soli]AXY76125.1 hypothetical protein D3H65_19975 [Paraflavitalea soli]
MNLAERCLLNKGHEKDSIIVCKDAHGESQSQYRLINNLNRIVQKYDLDGCLIKENNTERCDFLLIVPAENKTRAVFIELKGKKFLKAVSQVNNSIEQLNPATSQYNIFGRIIMSAAPKLQGPAYIRLLEKTTKSGGNLIIKSKIIAEQIGELL